MGYATYKYYRLNVNLRTTRDQLTRTARDLTLVKEDFSTTQNQNSNLQKQLAEQITAQQTESTSFKKQISSLSSTVHQLYVLTQTDKELLQKYSRIYFLNENYVPSQLSNIDTQYLYRSYKVEQIHAQVKPHLEKLLADATKNGFLFSVLSGYRSFSTQTTLKNSYVVTYGSTAANTFSADQGYSEHQLGSTVDFTTEETGVELTGFEKTTAYQWLTDNAYRYGFILSYPEGNTFYTFEPWHWRFVGIKLATYLHTTGKHFYDMSQRDIDTYLGSIFN